MDRDTELESLETVTLPWMAHSETATAAGFWTIARQLPSVMVRVLQDCWAVSRRDTLLLIVLTLVAEVFTAVGLLATAGVLEGLLAGGPTPQRVREAAPALALVVMSVVLRAVLHDAAGYLGSRLGPQVRRAITARLLESTTAVELVAFDDPAFRDALHRVRARGPYVVDALLGSGLHVTSGMISLIAVGGVVTALHPVLLPLLLLALIPVWWASGRSAKLAYHLYTQLSGANRRMSTLNDLMSERVPAAEIRAYTMRAFLLGQWDRLSRYILAADLRTERRQLYSMSIGKVLGGAGTGIVFAVLGLLLYRGLMDLAIAGTAVIAIRTATGTLAGLGGSINYSYENALYYHDYLSFTADAKRRLERTGGTPPPSDVDRITGRGVTFTYPSGTRPALSNVDFDIRPGEIIALVGENGSGKTTLAKLIAGLYQPDTGTISYGDIPHDCIDLQQLRGQIAVVAQDFTHWPFTAGENITVGRHDDTDSGAQLAAAASASGAAHVLEYLPQGPDTLLDPSYRGGTELSGGQWQRIAVARGFYRDATLLICDEPTAALDARTEYAIFETIRQHAAQHTVILITHRLANVRHADRIYVLEKGRITEQGTHAELMAYDSVYAEFYTLQAQSYT